EQQNVGNGISTATDQIVRDPAAPDYHWTVTLPLDDLTAAGEYAMWVAGNDVAASNALVFELLETDADAMASLRFGTLTVNAD
ncbi:hypothetical protein KDL45_18450, partial [bacterium]|nr:hypothetical protein [bacterium]